MSEEATAIKKQAGDPQRQSGGCIQSLLQAAQIDTRGVEILGKLFAHPKCHVNELISAQEISVCDDDSVEPSCECLGSRLALQLAGSGLISRRERAREQEIGKESHTDTQAVRTESRIGWGGNLGR